MSEYALFILNCVKYANKRQRQLDTWLAADFPIPLWFHVIGRPEQSVEFEFDEVNHLLYVNCKDDYMSLPQKSYLAIKALRAQFPAVKYILKTDDDMNCRLPALSVTLKLLSNFDYGGFIWRHRGGLSDYHFQYVPEEEKQRKLVRKCNYASGRFYFLSQAAADHLLTQKELFWDSTFEDNTVGFAVSTLTDLRMLDMRADHTVFTEFDYVRPVHTVIQ